MRISDWSSDVCSSDLKRGAPAIGGMSALIPIKNDPVANDKAMAGIRNDKARDARDGFDGGWVAHPGLVELAMEEFKKVLGDRPNQRDKQRDDTFGPKEWMKTEARRRRKDGRGTGRE